MSMLGRIYNDDAHEVICDVLNECINPVIVTDPPFNIGYRYKTYRDRMPRAEWLHGLARMMSFCPSVFVMYPEDLHALTLAHGAAPDRCVSWVYPSNTRRQHRDIGFFGISPDFERVKQPYRNPTDKRVKALAERTGGARSYDWLQVNQVKNTSPEKTAHPCQMPLAVMETIIRWISCEDITVIDPFAGSGTTAVACERLGIPWRAIEIDAEYCDIIRERMER